MKMISLFASVVVLILVISYDVLAESEHHSKTKHVKTLTNQSIIDAVTYLSQSEYSTCKNQSGSISGFGKKEHCPSDMKSKLKEWRMKRRLLVKKQLAQKIWRPMKSGRCGVIDGPLFYSVQNRWNKKSFTWKLININLPFFGAAKTRALLRASFNDWAKYAPLTFREVSQNQKADFELAFIHRFHDDIRRFDGPGGTLAYAYFPPSGLIRFEAEERWTDRYDKHGFNLRIVATHEIGHALGLAHSYDRSTIMFEHYQLMQPKDLLPKDDRDGIQALYGSRSTPRRIHPTATRRTTIRKKPITTKVWRRTTTLVRGKTTARKPLITRTTRRTSKITTTMKLVRKVTVRATTKTTPRKISPTRRVTGRILTTKSTIKTVPTMRKAVTTAKILTRTTTRVAIKMPTARLTMNRKLPTTTTLTRRPTTRLVSRMLITVTGKAMGVRTVTASTRASVTTTSRLLTTKATSRIITARTETTRRAILATLITGTKTTATKSQIPSTTRVLSKTTKATTTTARRTAVVSRTVDTTRTKIINNSTRKSTVLSSNLSTAGIANRITTPLRAIANTTSNRKLPIETGRTSRILTTQAVRATTRSVRNTSTITTTKTTTVMSASGTKTAPSLITRVTTKGSGGTSKTVTILARNTMMTRTNSTTLSASKTTTQKIPTTIKTTTSLTKTMVSTNKTASSG